jgi:hypothetical protein
MDPAAYSLKQSNDISAVMKRLNQTVKPTAIVLITVLLLVSSVCQTASAAMVGTEQMLQAGKISASRDDVLQIIAREDVKGALIAQGIDPQEARDRIDSLSDDEVERIYGNLNDLAAGQGVIIFSMIIVGVIIATVFIFNFTNVTDVFP